LAPLAVSVADAPTQISAGEAETDTLGAAFTATVTEAVPEQPLALVPVTVYVVVDAGLTTMLAPV
jgi:hypothetical protein